MITLLEKFAQISPAFRNAAKHLAKMIRVGGLSASKAQAKMSPTVLRNLKLQLQEAAKAKELAQAQKLGIPGASRLIKLPSATKLRGIQPAVPAQMSDAGAALRRAGSRAAVGADYKAMVSGHAQNAANERSMREFVKGITGKTV